MVVVGTVEGAPRLTVNRRKRAVLAFEVRAEPSGRVLRVVVRGAKARDWARILEPGSEVRLDGEVRTVVFVRAKQLRPAVERFRARVVASR